MKKLKMPETKKVKADVSFCLDAVLGYTAQIDICADEKPLIQISDLDIGSLREWCKKTVARIDRGDYSND